MARLSVFRPMRGWHSFEANNKSVLKRCESHWGLLARSAVLGPAALWWPHKVRGLPGFSGMSPVKIWLFLVSCLSRAGLGVFLPPTSSVTPPLDPTIRTPYPVGRLRGKGRLTLRALTHRRVVRSRFAVARGSNDHVS